MHYKEIKLNEIQINAVCDLLQCEESDIEIRGFNIYQVPVVRNMNKIGFAVAVYQDGDINAFDTTPYETQESAEKAYIKSNYRDNY